VNQPTILRPFARASKVACAMVVWALVALAPMSADAQDAYAAYFEADTMTFGSFAKVGYSSKATNGTALKFTAAGTATKSLTTTTHGQDVVVNARSFKGNASTRPDLIVQVDGATYLTTRDLTKAWTDYSAVVEVPAGAHTIAVGAANMGNGGELWVDIVKIAADSAPSDTACSGSLQAKIDAAPVGGTVRAESCIYREQLEIAKPLTLIGQPGSEIRGSDIWGEWTRQSDGTYLSSKTVPNFYQEDVSCEQGTQRCAWPEQVFIDAQPQLQVASSATPKAGEFKVTSDRKVVLGSDPTAKTVEVTVRQHWITGTSAADGVTIEGFTMRHAANDWRCGAVQSREPSTGSGSTFSSCRLKADGEDWNLRANTLLHAAGAVVSVRSKNADITDNEIAYGGQLGIHNPSDGSVVSGNQIHHNNTERFCIAAGSCVAYSTDGDSTATNTSVESGGIKIAGGHAGVTVRDNEVAHNRGQGIWFDVQTSAVVADANRVHHNARRGIFCEISFGCRITNNVIWENGWATPGHVDGAGIQVGNSSDVVVANNTLAWNADGIAIVGLDRVGTANDNVTNVWVHDNTVLQEDTNFSGDGKKGALLWIQGCCDKQMFSASANNRAENGRYWFADPEGPTKPRYEWNGTEYTSLASFNATGGEENGRYLSQSEKDAMTANKSIPARPEPH
jgi:hypothetical protein